MKRLLTILLMAVSLNAILLGQIGKNNSFSFSKIKQILSKSVKGYSTGIETHGEGQNLEKPNVTLQSLYVCKTNEYHLPTYQSHRVNDLNSINIINSNLTFADIITEGTMDDEGNWFGILCDKNGGTEPALEGSKSARKPLNEISSYSIKKIDKLSGQITAQYPIDDRYLHYGIAYNQVDKLIYFIEYIEGDDKATTQKALSKGGVINQTILYSLNPKTGEIIPVKVFDNFLAGLACTNDGVFYTIDANEGVLRLAKFTLKSSTVEIFGSDLVEDEHIYPILIDLEINPVTGKCYMAILNIFGMFGKEAIDSEEPDYSSQLFEISQTTGKPTLLYDWGKYILGGLAFDRTNKGTPVNTGKYIVNSPNGGETLQSGKYFNITWAKLNGIISGAIQLEYSIDGGTTWKKISTTPIAGILRYPWLVPNINSKHCLIRITNYLTRKEYDRSDAAFTISNTVAETASNFPNPFNPSTKITFSLAQKSLTSLKVFNSIGQQVAELVNGQLEAGVHEFVFNASNLSSGIYFYKLEHDGKSEMHKMILMK